MLKFFPDTPIYGAIGNHESYPRDRYNPISYMLFFSSNLICPEFSYPPPEVPKVFAKFGNQWLYDTVVNSWEKLQKQPLPPSARYAGYYSILIRPGLRLISLNTNFCYILNW